MRAAARRWNRSWATGCARARISRKASPPSARSANRIIPESPSPALRERGFCGSVVGVPVGVAQHAARKCAGMLLVLEQHLAVDDRVGDAFRGLLDAPAAGREIVHHFLRTAFDRSGIEDRDIRGKAWPQQPAVVKAEGRG